MGRSVGSCLEWGQWFELRGRRTRVLGSNFLGLPSATVVGEFGGQSQLQPRAFCLKFSMCEACDQADLVIVNHLASLSCGDLVFESSCYRKSEQVTSLIGNCQHKHDTPGHHQRQAGDHGQRATDPDPSDLIRTLSRAPIPPRLCAWTDQTGHQFSPYPALSGECGHADPDVSVSSLRDISATGHSQARLGRHIRRQRACDAQPGRCSCVGGLVMWLEQ